MLFTAFPLTLVGAALSRAHSRPVQDQTRLISYHEEPLRAQFESGEHDSIGDSLELHYPSRTVKGQDFNYNVSQKHGIAAPLSFGQLVAFGDYYGGYQLQNDLIPPEDLAQISDHWISNRTTAPAFFDKIAGLVRRNHKCELCESGYLPDLSNDFTKEKKTAQTYRQKGGDPAQWYEDYVDKYYVDYSYDTTNAVTIIAWQNWDHFGQDAIYAYSTGHTLALEYAHKANKTGNSTLLTEAYFIEGIAQHFLSDLFSTGHHRDPRRILHGGLLDRNTPVAPVTGGASATPSTSPAITHRADLPPQPTKSPQVSTTSDGNALPSLGARDLLSGDMHNEDCANGLFVENSLGEQWPAYGDNQFFSEKSALNRVQAMRAGQTSAEEVYTAFRKGNVLKPEDFAALKIVPLLAENAKTSNYQPLFSYNRKQSKLIFKRAKNDQRNSSAVVSLDPDKASYEDWDTWHGEIAASGEQKNMYPYTKQGLASSTTMLQFRELNNSMILTRFANLTVGNTTTWNAKQQAFLSLDNIKAAEAKWQWISSILLPFTDTTYQLMATSVDMDSTFTVHTLHISAPPSNMSEASILTYSNSTFLDDTGCGRLNNAKVLGDAFHPFDQSTLVQVIILNGEPSLAHDKVSAATLIMSSFSTRDNGPPKEELRTKIGNAYAMASMRLHPETTSPIFLIAASNMTSNATLWALAYWPFNGNAKPVIRLTSESTSLDPPPIQTIGTHILALETAGTSSPWGNIFLRIGHDAHSTVLTIDTLRISLTEPVQLLSRTAWFPPPDSPPNLPLHTARWLAAGPLPTTKLVGYIHFLDPLAGGLLGIITFTYSTTEEKFVFSSLSHIVNNTSIYPPQRLVSADFMRPVSVSAASTSASPSDSTDGWPSLMETFDNYGILGARLVGPVQDNATGTWGYELKGQTPALAGQVSTGLGWSGFGEEGGFGQGVGYAWDDVYGVAQ